MGNAIDVVYQYYYTSVMTCQDDQTVLRDYVK